MSAFAKLFSAGGEQILCLLQTDDDGAPELRFLFGSSGLALCEVALGYEDSARGERLARWAFARVDQTLAEQIAGRGGDAARDWLATLYDGAETG